MKDSERMIFDQKIKTMLAVVDGTHAPSHTIVGAYWLGLKDFKLPQVVAAVDALIITSTDHITPAHIRQKIDNKPKMSESERRNAAHEEMSREHWERMGFESKEAYEKHNHAKWLESQDETV